MFSFIIILYKGPYVEIHPPPTTYLYEEVIKNLNENPSLKLEFSYVDLKEDIFSRKGERFLKIVSAAMLFRRYLRLCKIKNKKTKHRKYVIEELVKSEHQYIESLNLIVETLMKKPTQEKLLAKEENDKIFCNIESIYLFHKEFYANLSKSVENFQKNTKIANGIFKMLPFFKLYYLYCHNFHHSSEEIDRMKAVQHPYMEKIKTMEYTEHMQNLDLSSLLIKPVQRLPKYVLLFKDLMKNTDELHPDYNDIVQCLHRFQEINLENNSKMNVYIKKRKVIELDNKFGKEIKKELNIEIVDPQREFLEEEALNLIMDNMPKPVICYFFSDLILVTETIKGESLVCFLSLDSNSIVRDLANQKYFKWIFSVYGKNGGGLIFSTESKENKKKLMRFIEMQILQELRNKADSKNILKKKQLGQEFDMPVEKKNNFLKIRVQVLGTMKRGLQILHAYTVYIIEITDEVHNEKVSARIFFRYSELDKLNVLIKQEYPNINITPLPPKYWFNSQKTKIIESRKLLIETFLQSILSKEEVLKKNSNKILKFLGLSEYFSHKLIPERESERFSFINSKEIQISEKFGRDSVFSAISESHQANMKFNRISKLESGKTTKELIVRLMNKQKIKLLVNKYTKVYEACNDIAAQINLQSSLDFKLFIYHSKEDIRVLYDDEYVLKALDLDSWEIMDDEANNEREEKKPEGFFNSFKKKIDSKISHLKSNIKGWKSQIKIPELIYKKYLFLPSNLEDNDLKLDPIKLELITAQIFDDIHTFKYILNIEEYSSIASLQSYIEFGRYDDNQDDLLLMDKIIKMFLPPTLLSRKGEKFWLDSISLKWKKLSLEIDNVCQRNTKNLKTSLISHQKEINNNMADNILVARIIANKSMKNHKLYGSTLYWVNFHKNSDTPESDLPIPDNLWLALNFNSIALLYNDKRNYDEFTYSQISKFSSFPTSVEIDTEKRNYRFNTPHSFEIYQLIDEYEKLHKLLPEMKNKKQNSILRKISSDNACV